MPALFRQNPSVLLYSPPPTAILMNPPEYSPTEFCIPQFSVEIPPSQPHYGFERLRMEDFFSWGTEKVPPREQCGFEGG